MTFLVFGKSGQVAKALATNDDVVCLSRAQADLSEPDICAAAIHQHAPLAVINAAAYTAVDRAEEEEDLATIVNGHAPGAMAIACKELGIPFVSISTDYVFEGGGTAPWDPDDQTGPLGAYGRSKLFGEQAIMDAGGTSAILRTSWVFGVGGQNFVNTMLRLGTQRDKLTIVGDQIGGPTPASGIASACLAMAEQMRTDPDKRGIYHYSGAPNVSWADFAREIFAQSGLRCEVEDIPTSAYPTQARRPLNSRMDCTSLSQVFGIERPNWKEALPTVISDFKGQHS